MDFSEMSLQDKKNLLKKAKDAYYNTGQEILSDAEFDELETELDLENNDYIGSITGKYTIPHSFIMGSLLKTQLKDKGEGNINWQECLKNINSTLKHSKNTRYIETTPKLDGCSFSLEFKSSKKKAKLISCSTRGDGEYGADIKSWFEPQLQEEWWNMIDEAVTTICSPDDILVIRGEILVSHKDFNDKYIHTYVNPRAFVAGTIGLKVEDADIEKLDNGKDLRWVCYDYRLFNTKNGKYKELSWMNSNDETYDILKPYLGYIGELPEEEYCRVYEVHNNELSLSELQELYYDYDEFRKNESEFALDGIVFKPMASSRINNNDRERPVDCIAMKFLPMLNTTHIKDISWSVGKTGEYFPTAILETITMEDGKRISKASLHNYNWIIEKNCGIGSEVRISLAGDIIPFVYEIVNAVDTGKNGEDNINLPTDGYIEVDEKSGNMHYMKKFSDSDLIYNKFISSADTLKINQIGPANAKMLYDELNDKVDFELSNIIYLMRDDMYKMIYDYLGISKSIQNIVDSLKEYAGHITLADIINSFNFKMCGERASELCAKIMSGLPYSTSGFPSESYEWALNENSHEYYLVKDAMDRLDVDFLDKVDNENDEDKTPIIMTGSPEVCTEYTTKSKWLQAHPQYVETTSWKECKILFTDDLESNTTKMQKAKKNGIEIKRYDEADEKGGKDEKIENENRNFDFNSDDLF